MSNAAMDQARFERIEAYLTGSMDAAARERFERELEQDAALREEVADQRENMLAVEIGGLDRMVRGVIADEHEQERTASRTGWWKYAAAIALLVGAATWYVMRPSAAERLYAEHHFTDPGLPVPMSVTGDAAFHEGMVSFKMGEYAEARTAWSRLLIDAPANDTLRYYIASSFLEEGRTGEAVPLFKAVADGGSVFAQRARWYLFLAFVRTGNEAERRALHLEDDPVYGERARAINEQLAR